MTSREVCVDFQNAECRVQSAELDFVIGRKRLCCCKSLGILLGIERTTRVLFFNEKFGPDITNRSLTFIQLLFC